MPDAKNNAKQTGDTHPPEVLDTRGPAPGSRPDLEPDEAEAGGERGEAGGREESRDAPRTERKRGT